MVKDFEKTMLVQDETEGCLQKKGGKQKLSTPHSASLVDFDGDCLSDLFLTVVDQTTGKTYYDIYLRREHELTVDELEEESTAHT